MLNMIAGHLAALSWLSLAVVTIFGAGIRGSSGLISINLVMAAVFAVIAAFLTWRTNATRALRQKYPACSVVKSFLMIGAIADLAMLLVGGALLVAAMLRVWSEKAPVFG